MVFQQTSLIAFNHVKGFRGKRHRQICEALAIFGDMCNAEISQITGLPINCITPRVKELRESGFVKSKGIDMWNGRQVMIWGL